MSLPFFYINEYDASSKELVLDEDTSRHAVQVLRMKEGEKLNLTDGKGNLITAEIAQAHKKHCLAEIKSKRTVSKTNRPITIGISLLKNASRLEWFFEKATEIGVSEIVPLICERTEKQKFRHDRIKQICISAMLQSQQCWLPVLHEPVEFDKLVSNISAAEKFIAHCEDAPKIRLSNKPANQSVIILIGPEGDFTPSEIELALKNNFMPVSMGQTRLRSETAGVVAAALLISL